MSATRPRRQRLRANIQQIFTVTREGSDFLVVGGFTTRAAAEDAARRAYDQDPIGRRGYLYVWACVPDVFESDGCEGELIPRAAREALQASQHAPGPRRSNGHANGAVPLSREPSLLVAGYRDSDE